MGRPLGIENKAKKKMQPAWRFWVFGQFSDTRRPIAGDITRSQNCLWGPTRERKHVHWYFDDLLFHPLYSFLGRLYLKLFKFNVPSCAITAITLTQLSTKFDCTQHLLFTASQPFKEAWNKEQAQGSQNLECRLSHLDPSVISIDHKWGRPFEHVLATQEPCLPQRMSEHTCARDAHELTGKNGRQRGKTTIHSWESSVKSIVSTDFQILQ